VSEPGAGIVTVGDELLCGDVKDTNSAWIGRELEKLGMRPVIVVTLPDERSWIARVVRWLARENDVVVVTGGLGGTPDDVTRDGIADAFGVDRIVDERLQLDLSSRGGHSARFASDWSRLPEGSRALAGAAGSAPAFAIENVYVLPGVPAEMRAAFKLLRPDLHAGPPRHVWRERYLATEDELLPLLGELQRLFPDVQVGSYPRYERGTARVELVLRSAAPTALRDAAAHVEAALRAQPA
jgi:molybdenum cofactor synthesis domain-containing protein